MFLFSLAAFIVVSFFFFHISAYVGLRLVVCSASSLSFKKSKLFFFHCHHPKGCDGFSMPCSERNVAGVSNTTALAILPNSVAFLSLSLPFLGQSSWLNSTGYWGNWL
uniref:Putative secreted protein n=1 Tax=Ixodes scapularis TaxID=6945 RepID=A0A4D5RTP5_IXOSC